jgi:putative iron-only hydrogenase system regulator
MKKYLATISILIKDRHSNAMTLNQLLGEKSKYIITRMGYNVEPKCISNCLGIINLIVEGTNDEIEELNQQINALEGIKGEKIILTE